MNIPQRLFYLKEHLGESKTLNVSKWKSAIGTLRKEKDALYSQITDIRKEVEQAESVRYIFIYGTPLICTHIHSEVLLNKFFYSLSF